jgi:carboxyl-terminal processing protease
VNMGMLESSEVSDMYDKFENAPAIIFDMRNYPNGTLWDLGQYFFSSPIISARWFEPSALMTGWYNREDDRYNLGSWSNPKPYSGKIYILVNQETQSQAEYTCQYLSHAPNATVIGTQTAGADGNISFIDLPGSIRTYFTSLGWYYDDWYQQQRNGVKIDSVVSPTSAGLRAGRDEILEAALDCLLDVDDPTVAAFELTLFPNPTSGTVTLHAPAEGIQQVIVSNVLGENVLEFERPASESDMDLSGLPSGAYIAKFISKEGNTTTRIIVKE